MKVNVCLLPKDLTDAAGHIVVVFDVFRASTTIVAALAAGASAVRAFGSLEAARSAHAGFSGEKLLACERHCLPAEGFDIGNSPGDFTPDRVSGRTVFLSTTNGTKAIAAAFEAGAGRVYVAALTNATATADALIASGATDVLLLASGTEGMVSAEDVVGAGLVIERLIGRLIGRMGDEVLLGDTARLAWLAWRGCAADGVESTLRQTTGGRNVIAAGLNDDLTFAARPDFTPVPVVVTRDEAGVLTCRPS